MPRYLTDPRTALAILAPKQHIFFLSHMRAYSSLFGHIMGSNPQICGYYELHIGYHGWKSLVRQKLEFFHQEVAKPGFTYLFDKVLHDDHFVAPAVLQNPNVKAIFCLRDPNETIPSILKLYAETDPTHEFNTPAFAANYYIARANTLKQTAQDMQRDFYYLDAQAITTQTQVCLHGLSEWLDLKTPLSSQYSTQKKTSQEKYGDTSDRLKSGQIVPGTAHYNSEAIPAELLEAAGQAYREAREVLLERCAQSCLNS